MAKKELLIREAFLATKDKLPDKALYVGKVHSSIPNSALFYLIELPSASAAAPKLEKAIRLVLEKNADNVEILSEENFEKVLAQINASLAKIAKQDEDWVGQLNAIVGNVYNDKITLSQTGRITGYIFRKGKISTITDVPTEIVSHPLKTFTDVISGDLFKNDRVILGNIELYNHFSLDRIRKILESLSASEAINDMAKSLKKNRVLGVNAIVLEAKDEADASRETLSDLPEFIYLDERKESFLAITKNKLGPHLTAFANKSKEVGHAGYKAVSKKAAKIKEGKGPVIKNYLKKSKENFSETIGQVKHQGTKVKTINYQDPPKSTQITNFLALIQNIAKKIDRKHYLIALIVVFLFVGYFKAKSNNEHRLEQKQQFEIESAYTKAKDLFSEAKDDISLGKDGGVDKLQNSLATAETAAQSNSNREKSLALMKEIKAQLDGLTQTKRIYSDDAGFPTKIESGKFIIIGQELFVITDEGKIYLANVNNKDTKLVASIKKEFGQVQDLTYSDSLKNIYVLTSNNSLLSYNIDSKTVQELTPPEDGWEKSRSISSFSTNLYLYDDESGFIWKHSKSDSSFNTGVKYNPGIPVKNGISIAIDGNTLILTSDGKVTKLVRGTADTQFAVKNIPKPKDQITNPYKIFANDETNYIYIMDKENNRILRFDKTGLFVSQYAFEGFSPSDFVVNDKIQKIYLLGSNKIFEINL